MNETIVKCLTDKIQMCIESPNSYPSSPCSSEQKKQYELIKQIIDIEKQIQYELSQSTKYIPFAWEQR